MTTKIVGMISNSLLILIALILFGSLAIAAPGDLDLSFGNGGIVITPFDSFDLDEPSSILLQPDGKILVCGQIDNYDYVVSFFIARYNPTGTLDTSFGENGKIVAPYDYYGEHVGGGMALQPDGKIIAAGYKLYPSYSADFAVNRYNSDGTLDPSFGTDGQVITTIGNLWWNSMMAFVTLQADGKIVVAGAGPAGGVVVRYNPDGSLDDTFGTGGKVMIGREAMLALQSDGKILAGGGQMNGSGNVLARYNPDGSLDSAFGTGGKVITPFNDSPAFILQPDGKIVAAGGAGVDSHTVFARYNANGSIDTSFAATGIFANDNQFRVHNELVLQPDGKIVAFGEASIPGSAGAVGFAVARLNPNGSPDTSFGLDGRLVTRVSTSVYTRVNAGALQSDGKILAFGDGTIQSYATQSQIAIVRYSADVEVSGRVTTPDGRGLRNAAVSMTDSHGARRTATTSSFGFYSFSNVSTGVTYTMSVESRLFRFGSRTVQVDAALTNVDFVGLE